MHGIVFEAALLGIIQGTTEFLPVSSDGHLALAGILFGLEDSGLTLTVMLHTGTWLATLLVLRSRVSAALGEGVRALGQPWRFRQTPGGRDAFVVLLASIPTAAVGLLLRDLVERWTRSPLAIGLGFLATGILLTSTRFVRRGEEDTTSALGALALGFAQGLAVLPGLSRSGSTVTVALWLGIKPERAFELSMLMSLPAVLGAVLLELPKALRTPHGWGVAALGALIAFFTGVLALYLLRRVMMKGKFALFALWVLPLSVATLALARAWPN